MKAKSEEVKRRKTATKGVTREGRKEEIIVRYGKTRQKPRCEKIDYSMRVRRERK